MNIKEITRNVFYCGVNDRMTDRFEGLWPLPYGVSYNSYIVRGDEKVALFDTVRVEEYKEFLDSVRQIAGDRKIDFLVINHMEPDHSGSIPLILTQYPDLKIVGNAQTIGMIKGFYHIDDDNRYVEIKEGDEIDLGGSVIRFHITPMVHWPETMMCYIPGEKVLFSGDAFGTFGALNGGVVDTEMDTDWYFPEMYRYYSNIVGKYGKFVQRALAKLKNVEINYICSTHGPVWHERIGEVIDLVDRMSAYKPEKGVTIVYGSMYGNTGELAEVIARRLCARGVRNIRIHNASHSSMSDMISDAFRFEGLIVGSATYSMRLLPPVETFMNAMETREIQNKVFATFGGYTWAKGSVVNKLQEYSERMKMPVVASMMLKQTLDSESYAEAVKLADTVADSLTL